MKKTARPHHALQTLLSRPNASDTLVSDLRDRGFRITKVRRAMIEALVARKQPMSALELFSVISKKHPSVNKTTIYRELDFLANNQIVSAIDLLDGMKRYELHDCNNHHHHLVCTSCREIKCVQVPHHDLHKLENKLNQNHDFVVQSHLLEFFGLCGKCS